MRKRCHRRVTVPMPPRGLRPKLSRSQLQDLGLAHIENLDTLHTGQADEATLWQWAGGCLTWSRVAELLKVGEAEMTAQLELVATVVQRFGCTGVASFIDDDEYELAKLGVGYMDDLAELVDLPTAMAAAEWSEARCNAWANERTPA